MKFTRTESLERLTSTVNSGEPVVGATVTLDGEPAAETDAEGRAVVEVPSAGNHSVVVERDDLSTGPQTVVGVDRSGEGNSAGETPSGDAADATNGSETSAEVPGFGPLVALLALLGLVGIGLLRRRA